MIKKDTDWIYGFKLLAALLVIVHHFALFFYPAFITGEIGDLRTASGIEIWLSKTPFDILSWGGNVCVCIFFIISGFLLSYKFFTSKKEPNLKESFIKRYFKLAIPMLLSSIVYCIVLYLISLFRSNGACFETLGKTGSYCNFDLNIIKVIYESLFGFFIDGNVSVNPVLWTMKWELIGSFLVLALLYFIGKNKNRKFIYIILIVLLFKTTMLPFILGMVLCDMYANGKFEKVFSKIYVKLFCFALGFYFCGFTFVAWGTNYYHFLPLEVGDANIFYHTVGSILIILSFIYSPLIKKILSLKIFTKFKNLSFEVYMFHWLIINVISMPLINVFIKYLDYKFAFIIMFLISIIIIFVVSHYLGEKILEITGNWTNKIYDKFFNPNVN